MPPTDEMVYAETETVEDGNCVTCGADGSLDEGGHCVDCRSNFRDDVDDDEDAYDVDAIVEMMLTMKARR